MTLFYASRKLGAKLAGKAVFRTKFALEPTGSSAANTAGGIRLYLHRRVKDIGSELVTVLGV